MQLSTVHGQRRSLYNTTLHEQRARLTKVRAACRVSTLMDRAAGTQVWPCLSLISSPAFLFFTSCSTQPLLVRGKVRNDSITRLGTGPVEPVPYLLKQDCVLDHMLYLHEESDAAMYMQMQAEGDISEACQRCTDACPKQTMQKLHSPCFHQHNSPECPLSGVMHVTGTRELACHAPPSSVT